MKHGETLGAKRFEKRAHLLHREPAPHAPDHRFLNCKRQAAPKAQSEVGPMGGLQHE